jgi:DNA-binding NarL/FixJ family response regulator
MKKNTISVVIADDTQVAREGLRAMLETARDIQIIGEADSAYSVPRLVQELSPDILIMDLKWENDQTAGWVKIREIKEKGPEPRIIALTAYEHLIPDARRSGADEVLTKNFRREALIDLVREVASRETSRQPENIGIPRVEETLTKREIEVLELLDKGLSDKEISEALHIQVNTAKNHVKSILQKLDSENRRKAVIRAKELKLL